MHKFGGDAIASTSNDKCSVINPDTERPKLANPFEMESGMLRVCYEQAEISFRNPLDISWELVEMSPEARFGPMHLQILESAFFFCFEGFGN